MAEPLAGIKVLDMTKGWAGPGAGMHLADQGAEVIKIEPPGGEEGRLFITLPPIHGEARGFLVVNRNKRGMVVDLSHPQGREIIYRLVDRADVFMENFRPGGAERVGLDFETLRSRNRRLIYVSLSAMGPRGPYAGQPGYDLTLQGLSGIMMERRHPDGTPMTAGLWAIDLSTSIMLAYGIALALLVREHTGVGQRVETALLNQGVAMQSVELVRTLEETKEGKAARRFALQAMWAPYCCADGEWLICAVVSNEHWQRWCRAVGAEELLQDPEFDDSMKRTLQSEVLYPIVSSIYASRPRGEWLKILQGADLACVPLLRREEVFSHPQFVENQMVTEVEHPTAGRLQMMGIPLRLKDTPTQIRRPAPTLGQHTLEILSELGYSQAEMKDLSRLGVIVPGK